MRMWYIIKGYKTHKNVQYKMIMLIKMRGERNGKHHQCKNENPNQETDYEGVGSICHPKCSH
jgi:hypothetical protein